MPTRMTSNPIAALAFVAAVCGSAACGGAGGGAEQSSSPAGTSIPPAAASTSDVDACALVTQEDATALFGQPAARQEGSKIPVPIMIGECLWTWDAPAANQLLQFRVWSTAQAYSRPADEFTQDFALGDRGHVRAHPQGGVDIEWLQGGRMIGLSYSKVGSAVASPLTKTDALKALARKVSGRL